MVELCKVKLLKPFMDSCHAPYKAKHHYWPGLLLAILVGTGVLQMWAWVSSGVYRNWCLKLMLWKVHLF